jgi:uroporphyrinogen-III synthase
MPIDDMLAELITLIDDFIQCDACLIYLPDYSTNEIVLRASQLSHAPEIGHVRMQIGEGITGWVVQNRSIVALSRCAYADSRFKTISALIEDTFEAFLSVPLINAGKVSGVINVHHKMPHEHTAEEIAVLTFLGEQIGCAIAFAQLHDEHEKLQKESREIREQLEVRKLMERAKAVLQERYNMSEKSAYQKLREESRRLRKPIRAIAEAVLLVEEMMRAPEKTSSPEELDPSGGTRGQDTLVN